MINFLTLKSSIASLLYGATISLKIAGFAVLIGMIGGTLLALILLYGNRFLRLFAQTYVVIMRGTPMLVQIVTLYYVLPILGITLSALLSAIMAIGLNSMAYISQVILTGIRAIGRGQIEAAQTLGFSRVQIIRLIILPQAFRTVFPALGNECITLIKDSSLASVIGVAELTHQGAIIMSRTYDALTVYVGITLIYLAMTSLATLLLYLLDRKLRAC